MIEQVFEYRIGCDYCLKFLFYKTVSETQLPPEWVEIPTREEEGIIHTRHACPKCVKKTNESSNDSERQHQPKGMQGDDVHPNILAGDPQRTDDAPSLQPERKLQQSDPALKDDLRSSEQSGNPDHLAPKSKRDDSR